MTSFNVLQNNLEELSLFKMKEILPNVIEKSVKSNTALQDSLIELTGAEIAFRDERARKINITVSHFPYIKTVKDFDFSYQPTINKEQIMDFLSLRFIEQKSNIIFVGSSGVGKRILQRLSVLKLQANAFPPTSSILPFLWKNSNRRRKKTV